MATYDTWEFKSFCYLKLVRRFPLGTMVLAHFVANPTTEPDYIYRLHYSSRPLRSSGRTRLPRKVARASREAVQTWPGHDRGAPVKQLFILMDRTGSVLLQEYADEEVASMLMDYVLFHIEPFQNAVLTACRMVRSDPTFGEDPGLFQLAHDLDSGLWL